MRLLTRHTPVTLDTSIIACAATVVLSLSSTFLQRLGIRVLAASVAGSQPSSYWATDYDMKRAEATLNAFPQFITNIDGLDIHFIHVRSKHPDALPLGINHGWPGSVLEQLKLIGRLTDPTAHGGKAEDAFDVVIPSKATDSLESRRAQAGVPSAWPERGRS